MPRAGAARGDRGGRVIGVAERSGAGGRSSRVAGLGLDPAGRNAGLARPWRFGPTPRSAPHLPPFWTGPTAVRDAPPANARRRYGRLSGAPCSSGVVTSASPTGTPGGGLRCQGRPRLDRGRADRGSDRGSDRSERWNRRRQGRGAVGSGQGHAGRQPVAGARKRPKGTYCPASQAPEPKRDHGAKAARSAPP